MVKSIKTLGNNMPRPRDALVLPPLALRTLTSKSGWGIYASSDTLYRGAVFGRDSLEVAEDLLEARPVLVRNIIYTMVRTQGAKNKAANEEEPGKIIHEYRNVVVDGKPIKGITRRIFDELAGKWGGTKTELAYYGSVDSTPHFLRLLNRYCVRYGDAILDKTVTDFRGKDTSVRDAAIKAVNWTISKIEASQSGLIEFQRRNPYGILNQVWKDSDEFYVHENGENANHDKPIGSIEVQGLAYDGLLAAAAFDPENAAAYEARARKLRDRTIELLWQEDRDFFALGIDYDHKGNIRIINTLSANPASLLDTGFFDELGIAERERYISGIVKMIMSRDFLTNGGIRSRALSAEHLVNFWDYHGSYVSWPKETYDIAKGLMRQGFPKLCRQLENRLLNLVMKNREYPEFVYIDGHGRLFASSPSKFVHGELVLVTGANKPERIQAWTVSAFMSIINRRVNQKFKKAKIDQLEWQSELESLVMNSIPRVERYFNPLSLWMKYPVHRYHLNQPGSH